MDMENIKNALCQREGLCSNVAEEISSHEKDGGSGLNVIAINSGTRQDYYVDITQLLLVSLNLLMYCELL